MAKIKVRGLGFVDNIDFEVAKQVKEQWINKDVDRKTIVDLGEWSGTLGEISSILLDPPRRESFSPEYTFTDIEFREVDHEMETLKAEGFKGTNLISHWLEKQGCVVIRKFKNAHGEEYENEAVTDPDKYRRSNDLLSAYFSWKGRKEFGQKKQLEDLDKVAGTMSAAEMDAAFDNL